LKHRLTSEEYFNIVDKLCALSENLEMLVDELPNHIIQQQLELAYSANYESIIMIEAFFRENHGCNRQRLNLLWGIARKNATRGSTII
jgi:transcriptional regulator of acetoin/glycerol metabolism